jgi:hypothetical protein
MMAEKPEIEVKATKRPSARVRDYFIGSGNDVKCGACSKMVKAPTGNYLVTTVLITYCELIAIKQ